MTDHESGLPDATRHELPALYLGHGAPPLLEDEVWITVVATGPMTNLDNCSVNSLTSAATGTIVKL